MGRTNQEKRRFLEVFSLLFFFFLSLQVTVFFSFRGNESFIQQVSQITRNVVQRNAEPFRIYMRYPAAKYSFRPTKIKCQIETCVTTSLRLVLNRFILYL